MAFVLSACCLLLFIALYCLNVERSIYSCSCKSAIWYPCRSSIFGIPNHLVKHVILYGMDCGCYSGCLTCMIVSRKLLIFVTLRKHFLPFHALWTRKADAGFGSRARFSTSVWATTIPLCGDLKTSFWPVSFENITFCIYKLTILMSTVTLWMIVHVMTSLMYIWWV